MSAIPAALAAINTLLQWTDETSPLANWQTVANVSSINGFSLSAKVEDVTSHSTGVPWRQKIQTLLDAGELTMDIFFIPGASNHRHLLSDFTLRITRPWRIVFPDLGGTAFECDGMITKFATKEPVDGVVTAGTTITMTGDPVLPTA